MKRFVVPEEKFWIEKKQNFVSLCSEYFVDNDEETNIEFSQKQKTELASKIDVTQYDIYNLISDTLRIGYFNAITDRKKIWGLTGIEAKDSIFDCAYESSNGKTYLGGFRAEAIIDGAFGLTILIPKGNSFPFELIKNTFIDKKYELRFSPESYDEFLSSLQGKISSAILLFGRIDRDSNIRLNIYADDIDKQI